VNQVHCAHVNGLMPPSLILFTRIDSLSQSSIAPSFDYHAERPLEPPFDAMACCCNFHDERACYTITTSASSLSLSIGVSTSSPHCVLSLSSSSSSSSSSLNKSA